MRYACFEHSNFLTVNVSTSSPTQLRAEEDFEKEDRPFPTNRLARGKGRSKIQLRAF